MDKSALLDAMDAWPAEERLDSIDAAFERLASAGEVPAPDPEAWAELERRLAGHDQDPGNVLTWEEAEARLKAKR